MGNAEKSMAPSFSNIFIFFSSSFCCSNIFLRVSNFFSVDSMMELLFVFSRYVRTLGFSSIWIGFSSYTPRFMLSVSLTWSPAIWNVFSIPKTMADILCASSRLSHLINISATFLYSSLRFAPSAFFSLNCAAYRVILRMISFVTSKSFAASFSCPSLPTNQS